MCRVTTREPEPPATGRAARQQQREREREGVGRSANPDGSSASSRPGPVDAEEVAATSTVLDGLSESLVPLWDSLSSSISTIEANLPERTGRQHGDPAGGAVPGGLGGSGSGVLPPAAPQILPLVEAFFVLCEARAALQKAARPEDASKKHQQQQQHHELLEDDAAGLPFQRFAEQHRRLLNTLVQQNPNLLEGSLAPLLRTPRLVEFENKRAYFQSRMRSSREDRHYGGTLRICVRRDHTFEDSFHQLRMRTPDEMRCKLSVQFQGEEGIDAGGVSREWYQVREHASPTLSSSFFPCSGPLVYPIPLLLRILFSRFPSLFLIPPPPPFSFPISSVSPPPPPLPLSLPGVVTPLQNKPLCLSLLSWTNL